MQFLELIPITFMGLTYFIETTIEVGPYQIETGNIFAATTALMIATVLVYIAQWVINKSVTKQQTMLTLAVLVIGGLTVVLRNETFIYLKPTIFNWAFALLVLGIGYFKQKPAAEMLMGSQMQLPSNTWRTISYYWALHFFIVGVLNLVVVYSFSEAFWVSYKLITAFIYTILMVVITIAIAYPHLKETDNNQ